MKKWIRLSKPMNLYRAIRFPGRIKRYYYNKRIIIVYKKGRKAVVQTGDLTLFNNLKTNENFIQWWRNYREEMGIRRFRKLAGRDARRSQINRIFKKYKDYGPTKKE